MYMYNTIYVGWSTDIHVLGSLCFQEIEDDTNLAGGEKQPNDKGLPEPMEVSETVPAPSKPERKSNQPPTPVERTAPETKENTGKGEEDGQAPKSARVAAPKRPPTVRRPPPPTARPVPRQREKSNSPEAQEQISSPKEEDTLQSPTTREEGEGGEKMESGQAESKPTPVKRLPSVGRPPPPSKRPHPQAAPATETDKEEKIERQVVDAPHKNEAKLDAEEEPAVTSPKQDKPPSSHSPGPKRPQPPAIKKRKVTDEANDVKEEEQSQSPLPPVQPQPAAKKLSIKRPPPPAMLKKQQPAKPVAQAVEAKQVQREKVEEAASKESTKDEKAKETSDDSQVVSEQEMSEEKSAQQSPGPKRPAPPINKRPSVNKPPPKPTSPQEREPAGNDSRDEEVTADKEHRDEEKSTEAQVKPALDSKQEAKELEVIEKKPTGQHSPGPKRPAPPSTKKLSIKKPPPPATARKPSVKAKQTPPAVVKKDEKTEGEAAAKGVAQVEEHVPPKPPVEQSADKAKEAKPVIVESLEKVEKEEEVSTAEPSQTSSSESPEKLTMTVLVQPGRKSPNAGRRSPNMGRKSPILKKKLKQGGQEEDSDEEELEGSVKIIKYPSGSSLTKNTNGKAGEAEGQSHGGWELQLNIYNPPPPHRKWLIIWPGFFLTIPHI